MNVFLFLLFLFWVQHKSHWGWEKRGINVPYIYFDFDGYTMFGRKRTLLPQICIWFDNYICRTNAGYATFIILATFALENIFERIVDYVWETNNKGRLFSVEVLDRFPPETDEEEEDDDDDDDF